MLAEVDSAVREKSWPVPARDTTCGLPPLLLIVRLPLREPEVPGLNVTVTVQLAPAARLAPQLLVSEKSPLAEMPVRPRAALPVLVTLTVWAELLTPISSPA